MTTTQNNNGKRKDETIRQDAIKAEQNRPQEPGTPMPIYLKQLRDKLKQQLKDKK